MTHFEGQSLKEFLGRHFPEVKGLVENIINNPRTPTDWEAFAADVSGDKITAYHLYWENCRIEKKGNVICAKAGARNPDYYPGVNYGLNEFLSYRLPNCTYLIDDYMEIRTDQLGRVVQTTAKFDGNKIVYRTRKNLPEQRRVVESQGGDTSRDDGGHLIQMGMGGPNELLNQVPMNSELNRNGLWRVIEKREEDEGYYKKKQILSIRRPVYRGSSLRPVGFEVDVVINGEHQVFDGNKCPFYIEN